MNYQTATDAEINKAVAAKLGLGAKSRDVDWIDGQYIMVETYQLDVPDYCNNPADMMPVVFEHGMSMYFNKCSKTWDVSRDQSFCVHTNPLRAAAIVYLMLEE